MRFFVMIAVILCLAMALRGCQDVESPTSNPDSPPETNDADPVQPEGEAGTQASSESQSTPPAEASPAAEGAADQAAEESASPPARSGGATPQQEAAPQVADARFPTPQSAEEFASAAQMRAERQAERGDNAGAFSEALEGWQALQPHLATGSARQMSDALLGDLRRYDGELSAAGVNVRGKPMQIR